MTRILLLDTALPLPGGTPRQRWAHHLRKTLSTGAEVTQIALDLWQTEWSARLRMSRDDRLIPMPRPSSERRPFLAQSWIAPDRPLSVQETRQALPDPVLCRSAKRFDRLCAELRCKGVDRILLADPLLMALLAPLGRVSSEIGMIANTTAEWHVSASRRVSGGPASIWHNRLGQHLRALADDARAPLANSVAVAPMSFDFDAVYLAKTPSVLVPATGFFWLDRQILSDIDRLQAAITTCFETPPEIVLMGFDPLLTAAYTTAGSGFLVLPDWQHLPGLAGAARAVFLPWMTPALARLAEAALSLGTPVLVESADARLHGLENCAGLVASLPDGWARALAMLLDPDLVPTSVHERIASGARSRIPAESPTTTPRPPRRISPFVTQPEVLYNPLSRMLLVRFRLRAAAQVEEIRLIGSGGMELNRLMANDAERRKNIMSIEGGVVIAKDEIGAELVIELHDMDGPIECATVATEDFLPLEAEIAWLAPDGPLLRGAFWVSGEVPHAGSWSIGGPAFQVRIPAATAMPMPEIGGLAVPFRAPLQLRPREEVLLWRQDGGRMSVFDRMAQRPWAGSGALIDEGLPELPAVAALRDRHAGARAWIVGNGPSVRLDDLARIPPGDVVFCFNRFYMSYADHPLRETYVVSADTLMVEDFGQDMIDISAGLPLFCVPPKAVTKLHGRFVRLPTGGSYLPLFSMNPARWISVGGSSVFIALQIAHYMGIRDIALYGMDYSFSTKLKRDPRFPFPVSFEDGNHFIKSYRSTKPWCPPTWRDISAGFLNARVAFETTGGRVVNATRGGRLETFPRINFDDQCEIVRSQTIT